MGAGIIVYLSNQQIEIIEGKRGKTAIIKDRLSLTAPEGTIINGIVMDDERFIAFMKDVWVQQKFSVKNVVLIVNSSKFVGQTMEMPKMSDERTLEYIKRGFSNIDKDEEKVYGFVRLNTTGNNRQQRLYAESISAEYIRDYCELFNAIGIKLKAIYSGESNLISLMNRTAAKKYDNFILMMADGMTLGTMLYTNAEYTYSNLVRCFHEQGTDDYAQDLIRSVSQIRQFLSANHIDASPDVLLLAGIQEKDMECYRKNMEIFGINTELEIFSDTTGIKGEKARYAQQFLLAVSGLFDSGSCSDFLKQYQNRKVEKEASTNSRYFFALGLTAVIMVVLFLACMIFSNLKKGEFEDMEAYNNSPAVVSRTAEYDELTERNTFLIGQYLSIAGVNENLDTYPWATSSVIDRIKELSRGYATISITSCNADTGLTNLSVIAEDPQKISNFVAILKQEKIFYDVEYTGYTYTNDGHYQVNVICVLAEAAGRDGDAE